MKRLLRALEVLAWLAFFAFAAIVLVLRYWVLPDIERYRPDIVAAISRSVGLPVSVGRIEAGWRGLRPEIRLADVRVRDAEGREALVLPAIENVLAWRSLLHLDVRLHSLVIEAPRLSVRRDAGGDLYVAGIRISGDANGGFGEWILAQEDIVVRNAALEWHDESRGAPPLLLSGLDLRLRSFGDEHALGLSGRPPAALGSTLQVRARLQGHGARVLKHGSGRLYAELGTTDLAAWRPWVDYPIDVRRGRGTLRVWVSLQEGRALRATADVGLQDVHASLGEALAPLELASLRGRLSGRLVEEGYELSARKLVVVPAAGAPLPPTDLELDWKGEGGMVRVRQLELAPLAALSNALPLPIALRTLLAEAQPSGRLENASFRWQGTLAEPTRFEGQTRFSDLALRPRGRIPGFAGLAGTLEATESKGWVSLDSRQAAIELPAMFPQPRIALDALRGEVQWERYGSVFAARIPSLAFSNADLAGTTQGSYSRAGEGPGRLDLAAQLSRADGSRLAQYLPHGAIMGERRREWLAGAVLAGQASDVRLRLRGDLRDFPFRDPAEGEFEVAARVRGGVLAYGDEWPRIEGIDADLLFQRDRMEIVGRGGTILGTRLAKVHVSIPEIAPSRATVHVAGEARGPTSAFLRFIAASPVRRMTGALAENVSATGTGTLRLKLELPLADLSGSKVVGVYEFADNDVRLHAELPVLRAAAGTLRFTESQISARGVRGHMLGGPVAIEGGPRSGGLQFVARGEATVEAVRPLVDHPWTRYLSGASQYVATFDVRDGGLARLAIESSLRGVASTLPSPFDKPASDALALRLALTPGRNNARDRVEVTLGDLAAAQFQRRRRDDDDMAVRRTAIWLSPVAGRPIRLPERPGTLIYGSLQALSADPWLPLLSSGEGGVATASLDLHIARLDVYGKRVHNLSLRAGADEGGWSAAVKADELAGDLAYRSDAGGRLIARLGHLTWPDDVRGTELREVSEPDEVPAIDFVAERFTYRGRRLGRVELLAQRRAGEWRLDKLALASPEATLSAQGTWRSGSPQRTALKFKIEAADAGRFLERMGQPGLVSGARVKLSGALAWQGTPLELDYPSLSGELELDADEGQFLEIEPGIGKLISLMSLQALPRRIALDFRDVFSKGFRFDSIDAGARVKSGVMAVKDFHMRGSSADVRIAGEADLVHETQDLRVRVIPGLGNIASTAVAAIVSPIAGVAAAIAQRALKDPLGQIFAYDYTVSGSWAEPKVVKVAVGPPDAEAGIGTP